MDDFSADFSFPSLPKSSSHTLGLEVFGTPKGLLRRCAWGPNDIFSGGGPGCLGFSSIRDFVG